MIRVFTRSDEVSSYRCHDRQLVFLVRQPPPETAEPTRARSAEAVAPKKRCSPANPNPKRTASTGTCRGSRAVGNGSGDPAPAPLPSARAIGAHRRADGPAVPRRPL